jgi:hypothetical protein
MDRVNGKLNSRGEPKLSVQTLWATAAAAARDWRSDRSQKYSEEMYGTKGRPLARQVLEVAQWPTPTVAEMQTGCGYGSNNGRDFPTLHGATGASPMRGGMSGSSAPTEKFGALNPEFVSWLMGYPPEWLNCAPSETRSSRKSRRNSSAPTSIP